MRLYILLFLNIQICVCIQINFIIIPLKHFDFNRHREMNFFKRKESMNIDLVNFNKIQ